MAVGHLWQGERDRKREISDLMQISKHGNGTLRSIEGIIQICRNEHDSGTLAVAERERELSDLLQISNHGSGSLDMADGVSDQMWTRQWNMTDGVGYLNMADGTCDQCRQDSTSLNMAGGVSDQCRWGQWVA